MPEMIHSKYVLRHYDVIESELNRRRKRWRMVHLLSIYSMLCFSRIISGCNKQKYWVEYRGVSSVEVNVLERRLGNERSTSEIYA